MEIKSITVEATEKTDDQKRIVIILEMSNGKAHMASIKSRHNLADRLALEVSNANVMHELSDSAPDFSSIQAVYDNLSTYTKDTVIL